MGNRKPQAINFTFGSDDDQPNREVVTAIVVHTDIYVTVFTDVVFFLTRASVGWTDSEAVI